MRKIVPARNDIICDACGYLCRGANYKQSAHIKIKQDGLDYLGDPACDASVEFDFCDKCMNVIRDKLNETIKELKEESDAN